MTAQTQEIDRHQIALDIEADPAGTYDRITRSEWGTGLDRWLPRHMHAGMVRYVLLGVRPGSFIQAIIVGDYFEACRRADDPNRAGLFGYAMFLHNYAPRRMLWQPGAPDRMDQRRRLAGPSGPGGGAMLTPRQNDCWVFLAKYTEEHGYAPSFEEMADALNVASKSNIHRLLDALEERGFIRRLRHRSRAIEVLRMPPRERIKRS